MIMTNSSFACLFNIKKSNVPNLKISQGSHVSLIPQSKIKLEKKSPPSSSGAANQQLAEVGECQFMFADLVVKLIQCLGVWCRVTGGGFLAAGFGIILGYGALGSGSLAGAWARLAVRPAGGLGGMSATAIPAGRVSPATTFFYGRLQSEGQETGYKQLISEQLLYPTRSNWA